MKRLSQNQEELESKCQQKIEKLLQVQKKIYVLHWIMTLSHDTRAAMGTRWENMGNKEATETTSTEIQDLNAELGEFNAQHEEGEEKLKQLQAKAKNILAEVEMASNELEDWMLVVAKDLKEQDQENRVVED